MKNRDGRRKSGKRKAVNLQVNYGTEARQSGHEKAIQNKNNNKKIHTQKEDVKGSKWKERGEKNRGMRRRMGVNKE